MEQTWSIRLIRFAAIFGVIGTFIGSDMAGRTDYAMTPIHAHMLVVGWLSVFAWGIFYKVYKIRRKALVSLQSVMAMAGSFGLSSGMWLYFLNPFNWNDTFVLIYFIVGGSFLLLAFALFVVITFMIEKETPAHAPARK
ncbi:hypothetical protein [Paenibacillus daejeonensis]|uniref:hypothetical protein n=1 Tax=Paenibacillus daejeonensis TaxID=135193 RepID=UPI0003803C32|nr:hypothetical protein [Paenibacillus daejeonensis]